MTCDVLVDLSPLDTGSRFSGTGRYVRELGRALSLLTPAERHGLRIEALWATDGPETVGSLDWPGHPDVSWDDAHELEWLGRRRTRLPLTLRRLKPRLFHATFAQGTPRGSFVPRVVTCLDLVRLVLHHDYLPGRWAYRRLLLAAEALRFHSARRVLAISRNTADDVMRLLHVPASKIDVALLGVDLEACRPPTDAERPALQQTLARHGLREGGYVFYMGRVDPRKNVDVLIAAFAQARVADLELVLIGDIRPSDQRAIDQAKAAAGHPGGVRQLGFVPEADLLHLMWGALGFVYCSTYEGFGNVPIEAMACGCPVISTFVTSMRETIGDAALIVPPRDVGATADAIRTLAKDSALRAQLVRAGIARSQGFGWRNTALGTVECYERALR